ncbi:hypothetical protein [Streptomyces sp. MN13]
MPHGLCLTAEELLAWALASAGDADTMQAGWHDRWLGLARQLTDEQGIRTAVAQTLARHGGGPGWCWWPTRSKRYLRTRPILPAGWTPCSGF